MTNISLFKRLLAATPVLVTAVMFVWPALYGEFLFGTDQRTLGSIIQIEFLVIGGGLIYIGPLFVQPQSRIGNVVRIVAFFGLASAFVYGAYDVDGLRGLMAFMLLLVVTYGGSTLFIRERRARNVLAMLAAGRWLVSLIVFFSLLPWAGLQGNIANWAGKPEALRHGAVFFSILFVLEFTLFSWVTEYCNRELEAPAADALHERRRRFYQNLKQ